MASAKKYDRCGKYYDKCTSTKRINEYKVKGIKIFRYLLHMVLI